MFTEKNTEIKISVLTESLNFVNGLPFCQQIIGSHSNLELNITGSPDWLELEKSENGKTYFLQGFTNNDTNDIYNIRIIAENSEGKDEISFEMKRIKKPKFIISLFDDNIYKLYGTTKNAILSILKDDNLNDKDRVSLKFIKDFTFKHEEEEKVLLTHFIYWIPIFKIIEDE